MMLERELSLDHTTVYQWAQQDAPELEKRCRPHVKMTNDSWKVDETSITVKKEWVYLYRAHRFTRKHARFWFSTTRDARAAKCFFLTLLTASHTMELRVINVDKNAAYPKAFAELKVEGLIAKSCKLRQVKYLNTRVEQDHRFIKTMNQVRNGFFLVGDRVANVTRI